MGAPAQVFFFENQNQQVATFDFQMFAQFLPDFLDIAISKCYNKIYIGVITECEFGGNSKKFNQGEK